jgi:hypothetical protein
MRSGEKSQPIHGWMPVPTQPVVGIVVLAQLAQHTSEWSGCIMISARRLALGLHVAR